MANNILTDKISENTIKKTEENLPYNKFIVFSVFNDSFGLPIEKVREVIKLSEITPLPQAPDFVEGVINFRGHIIPVVDLRKKLAIKTDDTLKNRKIIAIDIKDEIIGLIVDNVNEVINILPNDINQNLKPKTKSISSEYINGIIQLDESDSIVAIDIDKLLSLNELADSGRIN